MRRKSREHAENHERWLVSYADFVTLLFAFFVVMFATSRVNAQRVTQISEYYSAYMAKDSERLEEVLRDQAIRPPKEEANPDLRHILTEAEMAPVKRNVEERLAPLLEAERIELRLTPRGLIISLRESGFFAAGQADLLPGTEAVLSEVGGVIAGLPNQPVRLEGHTDNQPIQTARFPSNWELSTARAIAVLDLLVDRFSIDPFRVSVAGYGEHRPVADNATVEGRAKNRRVDIAILSQSAADMAPKQRLAYQDERRGAEALAGLSEREAKPKAEQRDVAALVVADLQAHSNAGMEPVAHAAAVVHQMRGVAVCDQGVSGRHKGLPTAFRTQLPKMVTAIDGEDADSAANLAGGGVVTGLAAYRQAPVEEYLASTANSGERGRATPRGSHGPDQVSLSDAFFPRFAVAVLLRNERGGAQHTHHKAQQS
jgi:chemotaxis protein MotB